MKENHVYYFPKQDVIFHLEFMHENYGVIAWLWDKGMVWSVEKHESFFEDCIDLGEL